MYQHIYSSDDYFFASFFTLILFMVGLLFGMISMTAYESGRKRLINTVIVANLVVGVICGVVLYHLFDNGPFAMLPAGYWLGFLGCSSAIALTASREIEKELALGKEISAQASRLQELLDNDQDGVISTKDIDAAGETALRHGISQAVVKHMRGNMSSIGHEVGSSVYVASLIDLTSLETRLLDKYKAWL